MKTEKILFADFLKRIDVFVDEGILYTREGCVRKDEEILVSYDQYSDEPIAEYKWTLPCDDTQQILINLQSQDPNPTLDDYIEAINYYIENDAFIDVEDRTNKPQGGFKLWG